MSMYCTISIRSRIQVDWQCSVQAVIHGQIITSNYCQFCLSGLAVYVLSVRMCIIKIFYPNYHNYKVYHDNRNTLKLYIPPCSKSTNDKGN